MYFLVYTIHGMLPINPIQLLCFYSILIFAGHGYLIHGSQMQPLGIIIDIKRLLQV